MCACSVLQPCLTLCDPIDCSLPGSSVHGIIPARILEWLPFLLQRNFFTQGSHQCLLRLLHWQADSFTTEPRLALNSVQLNSKVYLMHYNSPTLHKLFLPQSIRGVLGKTLRDSIGILRSQCGLLKTSSTSTEHDAEVSQKFPITRQKEPLLFSSLSPKGEKPKIFVFICYLHLNSGSTF